MSKLIKKTFSAVGIDITDGKNRNLKGIKRVKPNSKTPHTEARKRAQSATVLSGEQPPSSGDYLG